MMSRQTSRRRARAPFFARRLVSRQRGLVGLAALLSLSGMTVLSTTAPAQAAPVSIQVEKSAPASVLVGTPITYSLKASNPADDGDADFQYNLSFRDVLPEGVQYVSTSAPAGLGAPQQIAERDAGNIPTGRTILIWSNVADLPDGSDVTLTYRVQPDADEYPVGEQVTNDATGYASVNERVLAKFNAAGTHEANAAISTSSATASTSITALQLDKTEPSSEHELVRGAHSRSTRYSLKVTNNAKMATNGVKVVDYLPAGLEFLGCGGVDNSAAGTLEYPGAPRLSVTPTVSAGAGCLTPTSVTTVDSGLPAGYPAGVYTRVEWALPANLPASGTYTITYAAAIPLRNNVMPGTGFDSTANLDNNTGASTRETASEIGLTNRAAATGRYQGVNKAGETDIEVSATDEVTVTSEDIAVAKSIRSAAAFAQGGEVTYDLLVRTSEYTDGSDIILTDVLPDGLCPSDAQLSAYTSNALAEAGSGQCAPLADGSGNPAIDEVDYDSAQKVFIITFKPFALSAADASTTVSYKARMRDTYNNGGDETSAGDSFTNKVSLTGTTTPIAGTSESGTRSVADTSEATLVSSSPVLDKRILRNTAAPHSCDDATWSSNSTGNWFDSQADAGDRPFTVGSRVCFQVRVVFPSDTSTRRPVVTDYLPDNLTYEAGSFELVPGVNTAAFTPDQSAISTAFASGSASFRPGAELGANRFVEKGQVFAFRFSATVKSNDKATVDVQGNLAKLRWTDRGGKVSSLRDLADFRVPPVPPLTIDKTVTTTPGSDFENSVESRHGRTVQFKIDITNPGPTAVADLDRWDVLPVPFTCADVSAGSGADCTDPGDTGHPSFTGNDTRSAIRWVSPASLAVGDTQTVTYDVTLPTGTAAGREYVNTAHIRSFTTPTNLGGVSAEHFPASNVDTSVPQDDQDAPAAQDTASVTLPATTITKTNTTSVDEAGNGVSQAVPGETVTYAVRAKVPARTTVYRGAVVDALPAGLQLVSATAGYSATGATPAAGSLPGGVTFNPATTALSLPSTYTNATDDDQVFQINIVATVSPALTSTTNLVNTAEFSSTATAGSDAGLTTVEATSTVTPVHPLPQLAKTRVTGSGDAAPGAGDTRSFTLTASNAAGRPTLHDGVIVDCIPAGLTFVSAANASGSVSTSPATGADACASVTGTGTVLTWSGFGDLAGGASTSLTYVVRVNTDAAGGQGYTNVAKLTGSSLADGANNSAVEEVLTSTASATLTVPSATITKQVAEPGRTIGQRATYTIVAKLPANAAFFDATISDALPVGLDAASIATTSVTCADANGACALPLSGAEMNPDGQTVGWSLGDLASSTIERTVTVRFTALVADGCRTSGNAACNTIGKTRSNTAVVRWNVTDKTQPTTAGTSQDKNITSNPVVVTVQEPAVAIVKTVSNSKPAPGETFTYSVTASNPGGSNVSDAHDVVVTDIVPAGVVIDEASVTASGGTYVSATRTIAWQVPLLTAAQGASSSKVFTYSATLDASGSIDGTPLTNTATIGEYNSLASGGRSYTGPSTQAAVTPALPHVSIAKRVVGNAVSYVGDPQNFEIVVTSDGGSPAYDVDVTDVLPKNWTFGAATVKVGDAATIPLPPTDDAANPSTLTWSNLASSGLAVGKTIVIAYTATPQTGALTDPGVGSAAAHVNRVTVVAEDATGATSSGKGPYNGGPADATARIHAADLQITKTANGTPVAGEAFSWKIAVKNDGDDPAVGPIVVKDTIPANIAGFAVSGSGWTCSSTTTEWTCTLAGPIADGASAADLTASGTIDADLSNGTDIVNTASVKGRTFDPDTTDNQNTSTTEVTTLADLAIVKKLIGSVTAGENATWTLDVSNLGPSTSRRKITVTDELPAGSTYVSAAGDDWECEHSGGTVTCTRDADLTAGAASVAPQITIAAKIPASQKSAVVNRATVDGTTDEPGTTTAEENNTDTVTSTPTRTADLIAQKSLKGTLPAVAGAEATYTVDIWNLGPSTASGVTITDTLPAYMSFVSGGNGDWDCTAAGQVVTCDLDGSLAVGAAAKSTVDLTVKVASGHTGTIANTVEVTAAEDPDGASGTVSNVPSLQSDLRVEKTHAGVATAGEPTTYQVKVINDGPSDIDGRITVEDALPAGMKYSSVSGTGWSCTVAQGIVTCIHDGGLTNGQSRSFDLTVDVAVDAGPAKGVVNRVTVFGPVGGPNVDPTPLNNKNEAAIDIVDDANITVTKTADVTTANAGDRVTWIVSVENDGPSTADSISVADTLPAGLTIVSIDGTGWDCDEDTLVCTRGSLAPGVAPDITVVTTVGSGVADGSTLTNTVDVNTSTSGDDPDDNSDSDAVSTTTSADLALVKSHTGTPVAGSTFTFDLDVENVGPSDARGPITVVDRLPVGMTYKTSNAAWDCVAGPVSPTTGQEVVCTLVGGGPVIAKQDVATLAMVVDIAPDQSGTTLTNTAVVAAATPDPDATNNSGNDVVTPTDGVDLSILKSHAGPVEVGADVTFTIDVTNAGPSEARDVEVDDLLPAGLAFVSASGTGWTCATGSMTCTLDVPLKSGATAAPITIVATVTPKAYPGVTNVATVSTSSNDAVDDNDKAEDKVVVPAKVDLGIVKKAVGDFTVGQRGEYSLTVRNDGPTADPGVVKVTDTLPAGLTFVSGTATGWTCAAAQQVVTCERGGSFAVDASETIALTVDVGPAAYPAVVNTATVASLAIDTDPDDNTSGVTTPVGGTSLLKIKKSLDGQDGDEATWKIVVTNAGPTETTGPVVVNDKLPKALTYVSAKGSGWSCDRRGRTVTCERSKTMSVGESAAIEIKTRIAADDGSKIVNVASVRGGEVDSGSAQRGADDTDDATVRAPDGGDVKGGDGFLPDTGGAALWVLLAGLVLVMGGTVLVSQRRKPQSPDHHR